MMLKFTYCKNFAHAETREIPWDDFAQRVSNSVGYSTKEESVKRAAIVGGLRQDESVGRAENIACRTIASLDYDDLPEGTALDDIELALGLGLSCAFTAYTTFRHTPEAPRFRVFVPLSRPVSPAEYGAVVDSIREAIGLDGLDDCSYTVNQIMFLASHRHGVEPWRMIQQGTPWHVPDEAVAGQIVQGAAREEFDDLDLAVASRPLDLTADQVAAILEAYPAENLDYDAWVEVGMALYHQTEGKGYDAWLQWSEKSSKHNAREMRTKWRSFGKSNRVKPKTMASVIAAAGGRKSISVDVAGQVALSLEEEAQAVDSRETYSAFKRRVQAMNEVQLSPDIRSMLARTVYEVYAKDAGMGLREVKTSFKPIKKAATRNTQDADAGVDAPEWLRDWVYGEADCVFINTAVADYAIKREAFRAKFDRMPECVALDMDAAAFALSVVKIPTVVRGMYWPGEDRIFTTESKDHINTYHPSGIPAADTLAGDPDGQAVAQMFLQHVRNTIESEREGNLLIDFMAYVYRHPSHRVRWGMLLWGIEGNGKTYFYYVLQLLLGRNAKTITTSMIERPFNDWAVGTRIVGIEEIRISGTNKWRILDQLKPMISNDTIAVEPKGATSYFAPNFASYIMTTNHQDAVPMSDNDRRYCVIFTQHSREDDLFEQHGGREQAAAYFERLFSDSQRRIDAIGRFLLDWQISDEFNPHGRAPVTIGLHEMRQANESDDRIAVQEAIADYGCEIVSRDVLDVTHLNNNATIDGNELPQGRALANILREMGYRPVQGRYVKVKGRKHYVWYSGSKKLPSSKVAQLVRDWHEKGEDFSHPPF